MNKYLIEILKIRTSVILPGFGALMIANTKTGKVVLNKHLKFDDGILAKFISEKEGIDATEAKNMVSKFVREIETTVGKGEVYDIFQFGKITKNEKGELAFEMDDSMKKESAIITPPTKESKPVVKTETKPVIPVAKKEEKKEEVKKVEPKTEIKKEEPIKTTKGESNENRNTYIPPVKTEIKKEIVAKTESLKEDSKDLKADAKAVAAKAKKDAKELEEKKKKDAKALTAKKKEELKIATAKAKKDKKEKSKKPAVVVLGADGKPEKKKKRSFLPYLVLLLIVGGLAFAAYKYQNQIKEMIGYTSVGDPHDLDSHNEDGGDHSDSETVDENTTDVVLTADETDSLTTDEVNATETDDSEEVTEAEVIEEAPVQTQPVSTSVSGSYHIIGGGFSEESNATGYASKNGGTVLGRFDNLYLVALKSYDSKEAAQADLSNVRSTSSSAWIFKYSK